ncbi:hypothetical protein AAFF_G00266990 [Aldrovandia affinis]|uniref:Uncharacterized protein n=1 Tax=Aldrovandia affinis TaxID=143900 RepID=A0AAD7RBG7_9TELE|nr:hypothetical protein AAFF_G00266990 [Aldrovandia affinis]
MCEYSSALCGEAVNSEDMDAHTKENCDHRALGVCQRGCGSVLLHKDSVQGHHCCLDAMRARNGVLQLKSSGLEREAKEERSAGQEREAKEERSAGQEREAKEERSAGQEREAKEERSSGQEREAKEERSAGQEREAKEERSAGQEREAKEERLELGAREQFLLAQVSSLQSEARVARLTYQSTLRQCMLHISNITKQLITGHCKCRVRSQPCGLLGRSDHAVLSWVKPSG